MVVDVIVLSTARTACYFEEFRDAVGYKTSAVRWMVECRKCVRVWLMCPFSLSPMSLLSTFADVSINLQPNFFASASPSAFGTSRYSVRSHLFPASTKGTKSKSFTFRICECNLETSRKLCEYVIE
jgi:hypothetical protein